MVADGNVARFHGGEDGSMRSLLQPAFKPMLACSESAHTFFDKLRFPLLASPKLDGIRATVRDGIVYARSNKPIANVNVQSKFGHLKWCDGELIVGDPTSKTCYRDTASVVNSKDKPAGAVTFYVFDHIAMPGAHYLRRRQEISFAIDGSMDVQNHLNYEVDDVPGLEYIEEQVLNEGYEGLILRDPNTPYKMGRSTANEQYLLKLKRFEDAEAEVIGFEERMHNGNIATTNELGRTSRSSHKANKSGRGDLGALICRTPAGIVFNIGTGWTDSERAAIWGNQDCYLGRLAKYKFFPIGQKEAPRHPVFLGWRGRLDT